MNKFFMIMMLFTTSFVTAMELQVSSADSERFLKHFAMANGSMKKKIIEGTLSGGHPIALSFDRLSTDLYLYDNNIEKMIKKKFLAGSIQEYIRDVDANPVVKLAQMQIKQGQGNTEDIKVYLLSTKYALSSLMLQKKHPLFHIQAIGPVHEKDRTSYLLNNADYPATHEALNDYIALFIYQILFAPQVP